jgi:hypothetical protein
MVVALTESTPVRSIAPSRSQPCRSSAGRSAGIAKDFENLTRSHLAFVQLAMIHLMMRRIARLTAA